MSRYCNIRATTLEEILDTCNRHIRNIGLTRFDLIENGDMTPTDEHYIKMFRDTWVDLAEDVETMLRN